MAELDICPACHKENYGNYKYCGSCYGDAPGRSKFQKLRWLREEATRKNFEKIMNNAKGMRRLESLVNKHFSIAEKKFAELESEREEGKRGECKREIIDSSDYDSSDDDSSDDELEEEDYQNESKKSDRLIQGENISWSDNPNISPVIEKLILDHKKDLLSEDYEKKNLLYNPEIRQLVLCCYIKVEGIKNVLPIGFEHIDTSGKYKFIEFDPKNITPALKGKGLNNKINTFANEVKKSNIKEKFKIFKKACKEQFKLMKKNDKKNNYI